MKSRLGSVPHGFDAALYEKILAKTASTTTALGPDYKGEANTSRFSAENAIAFLQAMLTDCGLF